MTRRDTRCHRSDQITDDWERLTIDAEKKVRYDAVGDGVRARERTKRDEETRTDGRSGRGGRRGR